MTSINAFGFTYRGTAEGDHGVFTNKSNGNVYAGSIAYGSACVGVDTATDGSTSFAECGADGKVHGRDLGCGADGHTVYWLCEHGSVKEEAWLYANGTCKYNGKACRADYAPFVALQAKVVPIKARPPLGPPTAAFMPHSLPSPPDLSIGNCFGIRRSWRQPTPTRCAPAASASSLHGPRATLHSSCQTKAPRVQPGRRTVGRVHYACNTNHMLSAPLRRRARRAAQWTPMRPAFIITCRTPSWSVATSGGLQHSVVHAARTPPTRVAVAFRTVHLHSGPISRTNFRCACDALIIARVSLPFRTPEI
jgi:hypothetical protein